LISSKGCLISAWATGYRTVAIKIKFWNLPKTLSGLTVIQMGRSIAIPACRPMQHIQIDAYAKDFTFYIGDKPYSCPRFFAEFLSPAVSACRATDPTITVFSADFKDGIDIFQRAVDLCKGKEIEVDQFTQERLMLLFHKLGNVAFYESIGETYWNGELTDDNICSRLRLRSGLNSDDSRELIYLASRFSLLPDAVLNELSVARLSQILSHPSLKLKTEDSLYDFIASRLDEHPDFFDLFEFLRFEFLTNAKFSEFLRCSQSHFDRLNPSIWNRLCQRLLISPQMRIQFSSVRHSKMPLGERDPPANCPLERLPFLRGIVGSLRCEHGASWKDFIKVTSSKSYPERIYNHDNAIDISPANGFASAPDVNNPWIEYHFPGARVRPTHYAIRSWFPGCSNKQWPLKWKLEGCNDSGEWVELDASINEDSDVLQDYLVVTFPVRNKDFLGHPQWLRRVKFTEIGCNKCNGPCLILSTLEIFGELMQNG
jgi:hypothetical protein